MMMSDDLNGPEVSHRVAERLRQQSRLDHHLTLAYAIAHRNGEHVAPSPWLLAVCWAVLMLIAGGVVCILLMVL